MTKVDCSNSASTKCCIDKPVSNAPGTFYQTCSEPFSPIRVYTEGLYISPLIGTSYIDFKVMVSQP